jgi:DNA-binding winged helix-turn-helix (wHTH) protein
MRPLNQHLYAFGPFRLDTRERMLLREGEYVPLTPKALETLMVLVERGGRIVEKEELLRQVWPDTFVEDVTVAKNVSTLRKTLGESEQHRYIETIPKRGYRFVAELLDPEGAPGVTNQGGKDLGLTLAEHGEPESPERKLGGG